MSWFIVIALLVIGWILLLLEIFFIPGITILAIVGAGMMLAGLFFTFTHFGSEAGWITLGVTFAGVVVSLWVAFKSGFWVKLGLNDTQKDERMNEIDGSKIKVGDFGKAQSKVAPIGTGYFN